MKPTPPDYNEEDLDSDIEIDSVDIIIFCILIPIVAVVTAVGVIKSLSSFIDKLIIYFS